jgi:short-subunit dehydrogenase
VSTLLTGASSGIGYELAKRFARERHDLVLVARSRDRLAEIAKELSGLAGVKVKVIAKDLSQPGAAREVFDELKLESISVTVLVNCAGFGTCGFFAEDDPAVDRGMLGRREGRILNVASTAAFQPGPRMAVYYATKAYVLSFSEALANELSGTGVTVSTLCPGPTRTGFGERAKMEGTRLFRMGLMDAAAVADAGYDGLMKGRGVIVPGLLNRLLLLSVRFSPRKVVSAIVRWLNDQRTGPRG